MSIPNLRSKKWIDEEKIKQKVEQLKDILRNKEPKIIHGVKVKVNKDGAFTYNVRLDHVLKWFERQINEVFSVEKRGEKK